MASFSEAARPPLDCGPPPSVTYDETVVLIELFGSLDLSDVAELESCVRQAERSDAREIVIDLSDVTMIDSAGMTALVKITRRSQMSGARVRFLRGTGQVEWVMRLCRLHDRLPFLN